MPVKSIFGMSKAEVDGAYMRDDAIAEELFAMSERLGFLRIYCNCEAMKESLKTASDLIGGVADEVQRGYWRLQYKTSPEPKQTK